VSPDNGRNCISGNRNVMFIHNRACSILITTGAGNLNEMLLGIRRSLLSFSVKHERCLAGAGENR
jgi:hypothetical protein